MKEKTWRWRFGSELGSRKKRACRGDVWTLIAQQFARRQFETFRKWNMWVSTLSAQRGFKSRVWFRFFLISPGRSAYGRCRSYEVWRSAVQRSGILKEGNRSCGRRLLTCLKITTQDTPYIHIRLFNFSFSPLFCEDRYICMISRHFWRSFSPFTLSQDCLFVDLCRTFALTMYSPSLLHFRISASYY